MIFVSTGTQLPFDRLIEMVDRIAGELDEEIVVQAKPGKYKPSHFKLLDLIPTKEFDEYAQKYDLLTDSVFDGKVEGLDAAVIVL